MIPHALVFAADLFDVAGAMVVRANGAIVRGGNAMPLERCTEAQVRAITHQLHDDHGRGFWREDLGVFVVPKDLVTVPA